MKRIIVSFNLPNTVIVTSTRKTMVVVNIVGVS